MTLRRPNPKGASALQTISASRPGPDAQRHRIPVRDMDILRKPQARRYRYSRSGTPTYAKVRLARHRAARARLARAWPRLDMARCNTRIPAMLGSA